MGFNEAPRKMAQNKGGVSDERGRDPKFENLEEKSEWEEEWPSRN